MDEELRNRLGVATGKLYSFEVQRINRHNFIKTLRYLASHEDPSTRITFWLALLSFSVTTSILIAVGVLLRSYLPRVIETV